MRTYRKYLSLKTTLPCLRILKDKSMAYKILLNSMYGICSVPFSRYFCLDMAIAITSCARHTIKNGEMFTNELLNGKIENQELVSIINELKE
jgi:hypothetical protein